MSEIQNLHELYEQHDALWAQLMQCTLEERRDAFDKRYEGDTKACVLHQQMTALTRAIEPLVRDFEVDLEDAFGPELCAASPAGPYDHEQEATNKAVQVYSALGNVEWRHENGTRYTYSFRAAGALIAEIRGEGDYLDYYCSGREGQVTDEIAEAMAKRGWTATALT